MKRQMVEAATKEDAAEICPWADKFFQVKGGYLCCESRPAVFVTSFRGIEYDLGRTGLIRITHDPKEYLRPDSDSEVLPGCFRTVIFDEEFSRGAYGIRQARELGIEKAEELDLPLFFETPGGVKLIRS